MGWGKFGVCERSTLSPCHRSLLVLPLIPHSFVSPSITTAQLVGLENWLRTQLMVSSGPHPAVRTPGRPTVAYTGEGDLSRFRSLPIALLRKLDEDGGGGRSLH